MVGIDKTSEQTSTNPAGGPRRNTETSAYRRAHKTDRPRRATVYAAAGVGEVGTLVPPRNAVKQPRSTVATCPEPACRPRSVCCWERRGHRPAPLLTGAAGGPAVRT
ncbi:MAG: hypothetical protein D6725_05035 [Planctomycetota bacterium]|nr:MAG: hypothetical protein D6725_05035 [Planctomycetota bacterium]